jgi:hypothetical protein
VGVLVAIPILGPMKVGEVVALAEATEAEPKIIRLVRAVVRRRVLRLVSMIPLYHLGRGSSKTPRVDEG